MADRVVIRREWPAWQDGQVSGGPWVARLHGEHMLSPRGLPIARGRDWTRVLNGACAVLQARARNRSTAEADRG